jgi:UrcA family protein
MKTNTDHLHVITLTLTSLLGLGGAVAASEARATDAAPVVVSYQDLDLSRPADAHALYRRLEHAAAEACQTAPASIDLARHQVWMRCYDGALDSAVLQVRAPELLAIHRLARAGGES